MTNDWSRGRPVYEKVGTVSRFLYVDNEVWSIQDSTTVIGRRIKSGKATNSPAVAEAGASEKEGVERWRYWTGTEWAEGDITVTCVEN